MYSFPRYPYRLLWSVFFRVFCLVKDKARKESGAGMEGRMRKAQHLPTYRATRSLSCPLNYSLSPLLSCWTPSNYSFSPLLSCWSLSRRVIPRTCLSKKIPFNVNPPFITPFSFSSHRLFHCIIHPPPFSSFSALLFYSSYPVFSPLSCLTERLLVLSHALAEQIRESDPLTLAEGEERARSPNEGCWRWRQCWQGIRWAWLLVLAVMLAKG